MQDEVLNGLVLGIFVDTRILHLAVDGERLVVECFFARRDEEHVLVLQGHVGDGALQDAADVDGQHLERAVGLHAVHDGMFGEGILGDAGLLNECPHGTGAANLVHAGAEDGALHLSHV